MRWVIASGYMARRSREPPTSISQGGEKRYSSMVASGINIHAAWAQSADEGKQRTFEFRLNRESSPQIFDFFELS